MTDDSKSVTTVPRKRLEVNLIPRGETGLGHAQSVAIGEEDKRRVAVTVTSTHATRIPRLGRFFFIGWVNG